MPALPQFSITLNARQTKERKICKCFHNDSPVKWQCFSVFNHRMEYFSSLSTNVLWEMCSRWRLCAQHCVCVRVFFLNSYLLFTKSTKGFKRQKIFSIAVKHMSISSPSLSRMVKLGLVGLIVKTNLCPTRGSSVSTALIVWISCGEESRSMGGGSWTHLVFQKQDSHPPSVFYGFPFPLHKSK